MQFIKWKKHLPLIVIFILGLYACKDLFHSGLPLTHDGQDHLARIANFYTNLTQGVFIPRWAPFLNWGYGHPVMMFLYPLPSYFASLFLALGFSLYASVKLVFGVSFILSGLTMYLFLKDLLNKPAALAGAILYMFAPYRFVDLYVRGAIGEHVSFIFLPLILWCALQIARNYKTRYMIFGCFSLACLLLSHNAISIMFLPLLSLFMAYEFYYSNYDKKVLLRFLFFLINGFMLSAFFLVPAFLEGKYTLRDIVTSHEYASRFVAFKNLLYSPWDYGGTGKLSVQIGIAQWFGVVLASIIMLRNVKKEKKHTPIIIGLLVVFFLSIFLMLPISKPLYEVITVLQKFQFPWRFLTISVFCAAILAGYFFYLLPKRYQLFSVGGIIIFAFFLNSPYWHANGYLQKPESFFLQDYPGTTDTGESAPIWSVRFMENFPKAHAEFIEGDGTIEEVSRSATKHVYVITATKDARIRENTLYFPGWDVLINGRNTAIEFQDQANRGLITYNLEQGTHSVEVLFRETKLRLFANMLSALALITISVYAILERKRIWKLFQ